MSKIGEVCSTEYDKFLKDYAEHSIELQTTCNEDWMRINYAVAGWYEDEVIMKQIGLTSDRRIAVALRCLAGAIYAMGFESGRASVDVEREMEAEESTVEEVSAST